MSCLNKMVQAQKGRSMTEMLGVLVIIGLLTIIGVKFYAKVAAKSQAQNIAKTVKTIATDEQIKGSSSKTIFSYAVNGPSGELRLEKGREGETKDYFWIKALAPQKDLCEELRNSDLTQAALVMVNGAVDGQCPGEVSFYYHKNFTDKSTPTFVYADGRGPTSPSYMEPTEGGSCTATENHVLSQCDEDGKCYICSTSTNQWEESNECSCGGLQTTSCGAEGNLCSGGTLYTCYENEWKKVEECTLGCNESYNGCQEESSDELNFFDGADSEGKDYCEENGGTWMCPSVMDPNSEIRMFALQLIEMSSGSEKDNAINFSKNSQCVCVPDGKVGYCGGIVCKICPAGKVARCPEYLAEGEQDCVCAEPGQNIRCDWGFLEGACLACDGEILVLGWDILDDKAFCTTDPQTACTSDRGWCITCPSGQTPSCGSGNHDCTCLQQ